MSSIEVLHKTLEELEKGYRVALVTVIGKEGSGPRDVGSMVMVSSSGLKIGTIGGGFFEKSVLEEVYKALEDGKPRRLKYALRPENIPEDAIPTKHLCGGVVEVFINVINPPIRVILFGAGNVGKPIADLANMLGYRVLVLDSDEKLATRERYPYAENIFVGDLVKNIENIVFKASDIAIIAYGEVETDYQILKQLLSKNFPGHVWALCSRRRCSWMLNRLLEEGVDVSRYVDKLHLPAGLDIGSDSPEEIAVSILAEVICVLKKCDIPVKTMSLVKDWWSARISK